jgi:hypothetical protein
MSLLHHTAARASSLELLPLLLEVEVEVVEVLCSDSFHKLPRSLEEKGLF